MDDYEYSVVDESCNCRRSGIDLEYARALLSGERRFWPQGREPGPLHMERRRPQGEWKRV